MFCEKNWLVLLSCRLLCCVTVFEAVLKRFQRVSAGGGVSLEKKDNSPKTLQYGLKDGETT